MKLNPFILLCTTGLFAIFRSIISKNPALPLFTSYLGGDPSMVGMVADVSAFTGIVARTVRGRFIFCIYLFGKPGCGVTQGLRLGG